MADWPGIYDTGTATVAANGMTVTFQSAGNIAQAVRPGDRFGSHVGDPIRISAISGNTATLAYPWTGPAQTAAPYEIAFTPFDSGYRQALQTLLDTFGGGPVGQLAALQLFADGLLYADGTGSLAQAALTDFGRGLVGSDDADEALSTLGVSAFIKGLLEDANASSALSTLGVSAFAKTLLDDADAGTALSTLGVSTFIKTLLDDADQTAALTTLGGLSSADKAVTNSKLADMAANTLKGRSGTPGVPQDLDGASIRTLAGITRPAFHARLASNQAIGNGATTIAFSSIQRNVGNHFDGTTFTAPVAGAYFFALNVQVGDGVANTGQAGARVAVGGIAYDEAYMAKGPTYYLSASTSCLVYLTAGLTVTFQGVLDGFAGNPIMQSGRTFVSGFLIG